MLRILKEMRFTVITTIVASSITLTAAVAGIDLIKLDDFEKIDVDDLLSGLALILVGMTIDFWRRRRYHQAEIEAQKLRILKATMRTVQDIVNNFLNNLVLFEMDAAAVMPEGSLIPLEELIQETSLKLKALGDLEFVRENRLATGVGIEYTELNALKPAPLKTREPVSPPW